MLRLIYRNTVNNQIELQNEILKRDPIFIFVSIYSKSRGRMRIFIYTPKLFNGRMFSIKITSMPLTIFSCMKFKKLEGNVACLLRLHNQ